MEQPSRNYWSRWQLVTAEAISRLESLRTELDDVRAEKNRLETENARLHEQSGGNDSGIAERMSALEAERTTLAEECSKLKQLYEGVLQDTQEEQEKATEESSELRQTVVKPARKKRCAYSSGLKDRHSIHISYAMSWRDKIREWSWSD